MTDSPQFRFAKLFARQAAEARPVGQARRGKYDFAVAYPDPDSLPLTELIEGLQQALAEEGRDLAIYGHPQGYRPLREYVANKLARDRAIHVSADQIVLGDGSGQPIHMVCETLVDPGDVLLTEDFVYSGTLQQMRRFRADIRGVPTDQEGMIPDALEAIILQARSEGKPPKFLYTVPTFQNPQGWTMSLERRKALIALAQKYEMPILEDDCYVDLRFEGQDVPSLYALDDSGLVMYVASFSKIIAPGMRLGYLVAPPELLGRALAAKSGGSVNTFAAYAVHRFATSQLGSHIEVINDVQRVKRDAMLSALETHFGAQAQWSRPEGGLFIWLTLPEGADSAAVRDKILTEDDIGYHPGSNFAPDGSSGKNHVRLCFGYNTPAEIEEGIARLAAAFRREGLIR